MRVLSIFILAFMFTKLIYAQEKNIRSSRQRIEAFNSAQGFHQNTVNAIISDFKGYLWIATPNGLVRFDGYTFDYYYHEKDNPASLPSNYISDLYTDTLGRLWIITDKGICLYLTNKERFISIKNTSKKNVCVQEGPLKNIWVSDGANIDIYNHQKNESNSVDKLGVIKVNIL